MNIRRFGRWLVRKGAHIVLLAAGVCFNAANGEEIARSQRPELLTNLVQLRRCAEQNPSIVHPFRIVADVFEADPESGALVVRDASGIEFIRAEFQGGGIEPGATVCLEGKGCGLRPKDFGLAIVPELVVDNDGVHPMKTESGTVFLHAGLNPIKLQWFNATGTTGLNVEYEGPDLPRQKIPATAFSRICLDRTKGKTNSCAGLDYRCYEGAWERLPDFTKYHPAKTGVVTDFVLDVRTRPEAVGLDFEGFVKLPRDGVYTFYVTSDDGSRLFVGESSFDVRMLSRGPAPLAADKVPATGLERNNPSWATLEGTVNLMGIWGRGGELQMQAGNDEIRVDIFESGEVAPKIAVNSTVSVSGLYHDAIRGDGSRVPGVLLAASWKSVRLLPASGTLANAMTSGVGANRPDTEAASATNNPALGTAAEIKALSPDLARQELPVSIRGVVTAVLPSAEGAVVQDSTRGIFIFWQEFIKRGEYCQIDGVTGPGLFAPVVVPHRITELGVGEMPRPLRVTWDQLMNGSLDNEYAEIEGVVTAIHGQTVAMLTEGGKITLDVSDFRPEVLVSFENALVQIRGCFFIPFNAETHKIEAGSFRVIGAVAKVLQAPPRDVFDLPQKSIGELLLYDPKAAPFRLLKVSGQVIYGRAGEFFLTDGTNGMHVTTRNSEVFAVGDLVDAVGFLKVGGPAAELQEGVMRKKGRAALPTPTKLTPDHLLLASYAGSLVQVQATLMNNWLDRSNQVLELQSAFLAFKARIDNCGRAIPLPPSGSRLELTGVYAPEGNGPGDGTVNGFELLLHSPAGIRILATPSWWTLKRVLMLAGTLAGLLCATLVWNKELHRQVQERSRQLETEIRNRQQAELQRAAEAERARIARDLHDELGTGLTEVSLLASAGLGEFRVEEKNHDRFRAIAEKARALVSGLDVIVWAIDPRRNSLESFADYIGSYAKEFFSASNIFCRLRIPIECEAITLPGHARHNLFLAVKEALNNAIRHASATEVWLEMIHVENRLEIVIADNGRGFDTSTIRRGHGLTNLHERLEALHGGCQIQSQPGQGTTVKLSVPLPGTPE